MASRLALNEKRIALIDLDIFRYRYGFKAQRWVESEIPAEAPTLFVDPEYEVVGAIKSGIRKILDRTGATDWKGYLTGEGNFRYEVDPEYKANRKDFQKPYHYQNITNFLVQVLEAEVINGMEADDAIAIEATKMLKLRGELPGRDDCDLNPLCPEPIIVTIDKDIDQVQGWHYDFKNDKLYYVTPEEAEYNFWFQMLTGDRIDNVKGVPGIGPKKAEKILVHAFPASYESIVKGQYLMYWQIHDTSDAERYIKEFEKNYNLLWLRRE